MFFVTVESYVIREVFSSISIFMLTLLLCFVLSVVAGLVRDLKVDRTTK